MKPTKVFEIVDVNKELPMADGSYYVVNGMLSKNITWFDANSINKFNIFGVTHWLKETNDKYLLSKEELRTLIEQTNLKP